MIAKICVLRSKEIYTQYRLRYRRVLIGPIFPSRRLAAAATFHIENYISSPLLSNSGSSSSSSSLLECLRAACLGTGQLACYGIGARSARFVRKFALPTPMANLRKYALETSPVANCENMHSAKIILSPYRARAHTAVSILYWLYNNYVKVCQMVT